APCRPCGPSCLQHLRSQRDDAHEPLVAQLTADGTEDARATRVIVVLDDDGGVLVELDVRAVRAAALLGGAHDDGLDYLALLDVRAGHRVLHGGDHDVTHPRVATL